MLLRRLPCCLLLLGCLPSLHATVDVGSGGGACDLREVRRPIANSSDAFWRCEQSLWRGIGEWRRTVCPAGSRFVARLQRCDNSSTAKRHLSNCGPRCDARFDTCSSSTGVYGDRSSTLGQACSWTVSKLMPDPTSAKHFLQCAPSSRGAQCGVWRRMDCPPNTIFKFQMQVCVAQQLTGTCGNTLEAVCPCSNFQSRCPSSCGCFRQACCCRARLQTCPDGSMATTSCAQAGCAGGLVCVNGVCCDLRCPDGMRASQICLNGLCPTGYECDNGLCCAAARQERCPDGSEASGRCVNAQGCSFAEDCFREGCCRLPLCPSNGQPAQSFCGQFNNLVCPNGYECTNGIACCPPPLADCPTGQRATRSCAQSADCGGGNSYCHRAFDGATGCCALPQCPSGETAVSVCDGQTSCPPGYRCEIGGSCCLLRTCPNGQPSIRECGGGAGCPAGFVCRTGLCCAAPRCPDGAQPVQVCGVDNQCPVGSECSDRVCCSLPLCWNRQPAIRSCLAGGGCPIGFECVGGGCCPLRPCPNGLPGVQSCTGASANVCPANHLCVGDVCCYATPCPDGSRPTQLCSGSGQLMCAAGFQCTNGVCCRESSGCPGGRPPTRPCYVALFCAVRSPCFQRQCCASAPRLPCSPSTGNCGATASPCSSGAPCQNGADTRCPTSQQAVCRCARFNNACPQSTACGAGGACCASASSWLFDRVRPGDRCSTPRQCAGEYAACYNGYCVCTGDARSNGVSCVRGAEQDARLRSFRPGRNCGQFGVACASRSRPPKFWRAAVTFSGESKIGWSTRPVFWEALSSETYCLKSRDCTPDKFCLVHRCYEYKRLFERGCSNDVQCSRITPKAQCHYTASNDTMCVCKASYHFDGLRCRRHSSKPFQL